jgi:hypothetical protein
MISHANNFFFNRLQLVVDIFYDNVSFAKRCLARYNAIDPWLVRDSLRRDQMQGLQKHLFQDGGKI